MYFELAALAVALLSSLLVLTRLASRRLQNSNDEAVLRIALLIAALWSGYATFPVVSVPEGHVGVLHRFQALLHKTHGPGLNWNMPTDAVSMVRVTLQTDSVATALCTTHDEKRARAWTAEFAWIVESVPE